MRSDRRSCLKAFAAGVFFGFAGCSIAGHLVPETMEPFTRFHLFVAPETQYFPTVRSVWNTVLSQVDKNHIIVIVGGSSLLYGHGQPPGRTFANFLSSNLSPQYTVINLAMRAGDVAGMALFIAESLAADGYNVVFMADVDWRPLTPTGSQPWYYYIYWQYRNESFSQNFAPRDSFASTSALGEVAIGQDLNTIFRFDNLWTYLAYRYFGTIYTPYTPRFWLPRIRYSDSESERPWPDGVYAQLDLVAELKATNIGPTPQSREQLDQAIASWSQTLPSSLKDRTILVLCRKSPFIVSRIPHESQITWRENFDGIEQRGRAAGFDAIQPCRDFSAADYVDTTHLSVTGAAKLADIISTEVQRLTAKQRVGAQ